MSDSIKTRITDDLQQAKTQGGTRMAHIRDILRDAASQTIAEVKQGSGELREIATGTFSAATQNLAHSTPEPGESKNISLKQLAARAFVALRNKYSAQFKSQVGRLDGKIAERYGAPYATAKGHLENASDQYRRAVATAQAEGGTNLLEQKQAQVNETVGAAGTSVAQREQQLKRRLKSILQTAAQKL